MQVWGFAAWLELQKKICAFSAADSPTMAKKKKTPSTVQLAANLVCCPLLRPFINDEVALRCILESPSRDCIAVAPMAQRDIGPGYEAAMWVLLHDGPSAPERRQLNCSSNQRALRRYTHRLPTMAKETA